MGKLAWLKYNNSIGETEAMNSRNGYSSNYYPKPKKLNLPNIENNQNISEILKFSTPLPDSIKQMQMPTNPIQFNSSTFSGTKELSTGNINKNVPTTSTRSSTITINCN